MLVIGRKQGEALLLGDSVIVVTQIKPHYVRLAIKSPKEVRIVRAEIATDEEAETIRDAIPTAWGVVPAA